MICSALRRVAISFFIINSGLVLAAGPTEIEHPNEVLALDLKEGFSLVNQKPVAPDPLFIKENGPAAESLVPIFKGKRSLAVDVSNDREEPEAGE